MVHTVGEVGAQELAPGATLGSYELLRRLACGGMAEIYLARARGIEGFEKVVVLKRILPQFAQNSDFVGMFLDEARLSATLQHPNIAQVHDIGQWNGSYFFTMEYVHGQDVRGILQAVVQQHRQVPLAQALTIIAGAAAGLHAAHEKRGFNGRPLKIVHRDVSPSNVLVSYDGGVKLVDFGVAKAAQRQTETRAGTLKGKIAYMSPEQCLGQELDRRSDVFSLGILLYELTTARRLFKGDAEFAVMQRIVNEDVPPPSSVIPGYPAALEKIVMRALQRDRGERYPTAQELQLDIEHFAGAQRLSLSQVMLARFMNGLFADRLREEAEVRDAKPGTDVFELPLPPPPAAAHPGTLVFAAGTPMPGGAPGPSLMGAAAGSSRMERVDGDAAAPPPLPPPLAGGRAARMGSVLEIPPGSDDELGMAHTASIVIEAGEAPSPVPPPVPLVDSTRVGSVSRVGSVARAVSVIDPQRAATATATITGSSIQIVQAQRHVVALAAIVGAGVAALLFAGFLILGGRGAAEPAAVAAPPAKAAPAAAPTAPAIAAPAPTPVAPPSAPAPASAPPVVEPAAPAPSPTAAAPAKKHAAKPRAKAPTAPAPAAGTDWGLDSPLPPK